ncbi:MAG: hypothetical protein HYZ75_05535 [Elusimicrobia bacterium]|nr:hypothetical protein [Elusimicrobiota bacterium]
MARFNVSISDKAETDLLSIPFPLRRQINQRILGLAAAPRPDGFMSIGTDGGAALFIHGYALLYSIDDEDALVIVIAILPDTLPPKGS